LKRPGVRASNRAESQRIEIVVVDPAVEHVDPLRPLGRAHIDDVVVDDEIGALDQLDPISSARKECS